MITLITGLPGAGKTLYTLDYVNALATKSNRPVFYSGIKDLKLPWFEIDPEKWHECPEGAIIVIDECQRLFRPRANGSKVPEYVEQLETHRHRGQDLFLITQHPTLVEVNVRRLVGQHFHAIRKFGMQKSRIHEFNACRDNPDKQRKDSIKHDYNYNKKVYDFYKSAEVHTVQRRIPMFIKLTIIFVPIVLVFGGYWTYNFFNKKYISGMGSKNDALSAQFDKDQKNTTQNSVRNDDVKNQSYTATHRAEVSGLPFTAPAYQAQMTPKQIPYPASCVKSKTDCTCYTQQATRILDMPKDMCENVVKNGFFVDWQEPEQQRNQSQIQSTQSQYDRQQRPNQQLFTVSNIEQKPQQFESTLPSAKVVVKQR